VPQIKQATLITRQLHLLSQLNAHLLRAEGVTGLPMTMLAQTCL